MIFHNEIKFEDSMSITLQIIQSFFRAFNITAFMSHMYITPLACRLMFLLFQSGRDYELTHRSLHFLNPCYHSVPSMHSALSQSTALHPITRHTASTNTPTPSKIPLQVHREPLPPNPLANPPLKSTLSYTHLEPFSQTSAPLYTQPSYGSGRTSSTTWQTKSGSLGSLNEKTVPSYQVIISPVIRCCLVIGWGGDRSLEGRQLTSG